MTKLVGEIAPVQAKEALQRLYIRLKSQQVSVNPVMTAGASRTPDSLPFYESE